MLAAAETPRVSVVMPVHNAMPFLDIAVESILGQTFQDFEFVILDDASTDGSTERLREWASREPRIRLMEERRNLGPALSSQRVAEAARAPIVARMDADDISCPRRLEDEIKVLDRFPEVGVVGGLYDIIDASGRKIRGPEAWRLSNQVVPPFGNGPLMYRREVLDEVGGYRRQCEFWEDHDLIIRMSAVSKIMILPHSVYQARQSPVSTRFVSEQRRVEHALDLMYRCRQRLEEHRSYDDLLAAPTLPNARIDPRVFISIGSMTLWSAGTPRLFRRLIKKGDLRGDFRSLSALVWTAWASLEPRTLRVFIRALLVARRIRAASASRTAGPVAWSAPTLRERDTTRLAKPPLPDRSRQPKTAHRPATAQAASSVRMMAE